MDITVTITFPVDTNNAQLIADIKEYYNARFPVPQDAEGNPIDRPNSEYIEFIRVDMRNYGQNAKFLFREWRLNKRNQEAQSTVLPDAEWGEAVTS